MLSATNADTIVPYKQVPKWNLNKFLKMVSFQFYLKAATCSPCSMFSLLLKYQYITQDSQMKSARDMMKPWVQNHNIMPNMMIIIGGMGISEDSVILIQFHIILQNPHQTPALIPLMTRMEKSGNTGIFYESTTLTTLISEPRCFSLSFLLQMRTISKMIPRQVMATSEYLMTSVFTFISLVLDWSTQMLTQSNTIREYAMNARRAMHRSRNK